MQVSLLIYLPVEITGASYSYTKVEFNTKKTTI